MEDYETDTEQFLPIRTYHRGRLYIMKHDARRRAWILRDGSGLILGIRDDPDRLLAALERDDFGTRPAFDILSLFEEN